MKTHLEVCPYFRCDGCGDHPLKTDWDSHKSTCAGTKVICRKCRGVIAKTEFPEHQKICTKEKCPKCSKCFERDEMVAHRESCNWRYCTYCGYLYSPEIYETQHGNKDLCRKQICVGCGRRTLAENLAAHMSNCELRLCHNCRQRFHMSDIEEHLKNCSWCQYCKKNVPPNHDCVVRRCFRCDKNVQVHEYDTYWVNCDWRECLKCPKRILKNNLVSHLQSCSGRNMESRRRRVPGNQPGIGFRVRGNDPINETLMSKETNAKDNRSPAEIFTAQKFLDLENFLSTPRIVEAKKDWQESPHQILIGDFEYHTRLKRYGETFGNYFSHVSIFQFYLLDATGKPIVEALQIDHGWTQETLFTEGLQVLQTNGDPDDPDKGKSIEILQRLVDKIYNPEVAKAFPENVLTLNGIADKIRTHVNEHGPILHFHEWSANRGDYQCLWNILAAVGAEDLLQSCPKSLKNQSPYHWWRQTARKYNVLLTSGTLALGKLYKSIFPKNEDLVNKWHFAEADVTMTKDLIEFHFDLVVDDNEAEPEMPLSDNDNDDNDEDEDLRSWDARDNPPLDTQKDLALQLGCLDIGLHAPSADNNSDWNSSEEDGADKMSIDIPQIASKSSNSPKPRIHFRQFEADRKGLKRTGEPEDFPNPKRTRRNSPKPNLKFTQFEAEPKIIKRSSEPEYSCNSKRPRRR